MHAGQSICLRTFREIHILMNKIIVWPNLASFILAGIKDECWPKKGLMLNGFLLNFAFGSNI